MKVKTLISIILIILFMHKTNAQIAEGFTALTTGQVIEQISNEAKGVIQQAEQSGDFILKRSSQEVLYILDAFKATNENLLDKAFNKIGTERKAILNKIAETTNNLETETKLTLNRAEQILDQLNILVRDVTFKKYPVIFRYRGGIIIPGNKLKVKIIIDGANLNRVSRPILLFREKKYLANQLGESIYFELPKDIFSPNKNTFLSEVGQLHIEHKYGGFLGLFEKTKVTKYDLNIVTLPNVLGKAKFSYQEKIEEKKEKTFSGHVSHNSSSRKWDCRSFSYSPSSSNRRINPDRSWVRPGTGNKRGQLRNVSIRDVGISFNICCYRGLLDKRNGDRHVDYYYVEEWIETKYENREASKSFSWYSDAVLKAKDDSKNLLLDIELFTGKKVTLTSSGKASKYINVTFDNEQNLIILKPIIPNDILRL